MDAHRPHIPSFFNTLFRYGCRFRAPSNSPRDAERKEGKGEKGTDVVKATETGDKIDQQAESNGKRGGEAEGQKPRLLCSVEEGSVDDFFRLAQILGEGGGPSMQRCVLGIRIRYWR